MTLLDDSLPTTLHQWLFDDDSSMMTLQQWLLPMPSAKSFYQQEKKNASIKRPVVAISLGIIWLFAIGIKKFHRAFFEKSEFENFEYFQIFFSSQTAPRSL